LLVSRDGSSKLLDGGDGAGNRLGNGDISVTREWLRNLNNLFLNAFNGNRLRNIDPPDNGDLLLDNLFNRNGASDFNLLKLFNRAEALNGNVNINRNLIGLRNVTVHGDRNRDLTRDLNRARDLNGNLAGNLDRARNLNRNLARDLDRDGDIHGNIYGDRDINRDLNGLRSHSADNFDGVGDINLNLNFFGNGNADGDVVRNVNVTNDFNVVRDVDADFSRDGHINGNIDGNGN
jgi:hypothetical protein